MRKRRRRKHRLRKRRKRESSGWTRMMSSQSVASRKVKVFFFRQDLILGFVYQPDSGWFLWTE
jgi:hypothetical protein